MTPEKMHQKMGAILKKPGFSLLTSYKDDFEVLDREILNAEWHAQSRALWIVREMGTDLVSLGVHPKICEWGKARLESDERQALFLLTQSGVKEIDRAQARAELGRYEWSIDPHGLISCKGAGIAHLVDMPTKYVESNGARLVASPRLAAVKPVEAWTAAEATALGGFVMAEAVKRSQSLFCGVRGATVDGKDFHSILDAKRASWLAQQAAKESKRQGALAY
jgi:hypothetical protein